MVSFLTLGCLTLRHLYTSIGRPAGLIPRACTWVTVMGGCLIRNWPSGCQPLGMYHYHTGVKHCVIAWMDSRLQTACWCSAPWGRSGGSMSGSLSDLIIILILIILYIGGGKPWDSAHPGSRKSQHPVRLHPGFSNRTCPKRYFKQTTPGVVVHVSLGVWWVWLPRGPEYIYLFKENRWPQAIPPISTHEKFCLIKVWSW